MLVAVATARVRRTFHDVVRQERSVRLQVVHKPLQYLNEFRVDAFVDVLQCFVRSGGVVVRKFVARLAGQSKHSLRFFNSTLIRVALHIQGQPDEHHLDCAVTVIERDFKHRPLNVVR